MEKYFIVYFGQDEKDGLLPIEPLCVLKEEDINREEGEVCVNGEWEFFDSESSNFYNDEGDLAYECQPGDLVFESMGILAFYRKGLNTPAPVVGGFSDAIIGTVPEIKEYMADYVKEMGEDFATVNFNESKTNKNMKQNTVKLNESQLKKIVAESVKRVIQEGLFNNVIPADQATAQWSKIAQKYGYKGVTYGNGQLSLYWDYNGERQKKPLTNVALPKVKSTGMFGTGYQAFSTKDVQNVSMQLNNVLQQQKLAGGQQQQDWDVSMNQLRQHWGQQDAKEAERKKRAEYFKNDAPGGTYYGEDGHLYATGGGLVHTPDMPR